MRSVLPSCLKLRREDSYIIIKEIDGIWNMERGVRQEYQSTGICKSMLRETLSSYNMLVWTFVACAVLKTD